MGWAKYFEDNLEIIHERQYMMEHIDNVIPIKVRVEVAVEPITIKPKKQYEDKYIFCKECGKPFLFSVKSQRFFESQNWENPKRCKCCREERKIKYLMYA